MRLLLMSMVYTSFLTSCRTTAAGGTLPTQEKKRLRMFTQHVPLWGGISVSTQEKKRLRILGN